MANAAAAKNPPKSKGRARLRARRRARQNPSGGGGGGGPRANPPILTDFTNVILPGFGAYAATRFLQRVVFTLASKRWPRFAKHLHAASGLAAFGGSWFALHRIKSAAKYHDGILVGAGIAALQGVAQAYLPKYAWMTSDVTGSQAPAGLAKGSNGNGAGLPGASDGDEFSYLEDEIMDPPRARTVAAGRKSAGPMSSTLRMAAQAAGDAPGQGVDNDLDGELDPGEDLDDLGGGIFDGGSLSN